MTADIIILPTEREVNRCFARYARLRRRMVNRPGLARNKQFIAEVEAAHYEFLNNYTKWARRR